MKKTILISGNDGGQRIDKFLTKTFPNLPQSMLYKAIRKKDVKINNKRCEISSKIYNGDVLYLYLPEDSLQQKPKEWDFLKAPVNLSILYEDKNLMILDKKPGLIVHPDENYHFDSLISRIQHYLYNNKEYIPEEESSFAPALINRIDRNTGGIVMAAKNAETLRIMNQKVKDREISKLYLCIVCGKTRKNTETLSAYLKKNESQNRVYISDHPSENAKNIRTKYTVLAEKRDFSLLEVDLLTGRTHQIRAHLAFIGNPLAGDGKYGTNSVNKKIRYTYQALYSHKLRFKFTSDAGILEYLNGKEFITNDPWFLEDFNKFI